MKSYATSRALSWGNRIFLLNILECWLKPTSVMYLFLKVLSMVVMVLLGRGTIVCWINQCLPCNNNNKNTPGSDREKIVTDRHICFGDPLNIWMGMCLFSGTNPQNIALALWNLILCSLCPYLLFHFYANLSGTNPQNVGFALWNLILCSLRPYLLSHFYANLPDRLARKSAT